MSLKVADHSVVVVRDGKQKVIAPGTAFKFTESEIADIKRYHGEESVRDPINETAGLEEKPAKPTAAEVAEAKAKAQAEKAAKKAAAAAGGTGEKSDEDDQDSI